MNSFIAWLKSKASWAHGLAAGLIAIAGLITTDLTFRDDVLKFFSVHPKLGSQLILLAGIITTYVNSQKKK